MGRIGGHYRPGQFAPTNPFNKDTDGDGLADNVETDTGVFVSPLNTGSDPLSIDSDGDTYSDGTEVSQGSDPNDPNSVPSPLPIISLDATTNYPAGQLLVWTNTGRLGGAFTNENGGGSIQTIQGINGVTMPGLTSYIGPAATPLSGNANFTVEAWVYNPTLDLEEAIIGWGRRGGPVGTMSAFTDGSEQNDFGCMTHWAADLSWNGANVRSPARWKYLAYTYNGTTLAQSNYTDSGSSVVAGFGNVLGAPLTVVDSLDSGVTHLPFRVGDETGGNGLPATAALPGFSFTGTIGRIRVYTRVVPLSELQSNFAADAPVFGILNDVDGLPIWWKRVYGFPIGTDVGSQDPDGDGLTNSQEYQNNTNPLVADSDGDGLTDGQEVLTYGSNPNNADTSIDGLPDAQAVALGLSPLAVDSDGDGFDDATEVLYGTNPLDPSSFPDLSVPRPFVNLDATALPLGPLPVWTNNNALGWSFKAPSNAVANVQIVDGSRAVVFNGTNYYTGLGEPYSFATNAARSVEAWIWNPTVEDEETVFAWSRRGGPDGSNTALSHGRNATFGAVQFWGTFDVPWGTNAAQIVSNTPAAKWIHIAFTYDGASNTVAYLNGNVANSVTEPNLLNTYLFDPLDPLNTGAHVNHPIGRSLPFRVGCQNDPSGAPSVPFATMAIARVKAYNSALSAAQVAADYNAEKAAFPGAPRITNVKFYGGTPIFTFDWTPAPAPGHSYRVETNSDLSNPNGWNAAATGLTSGPFTNSATGTPKFYRLRVD
jgi:hypothetical protein